MAIHLEKLSKDVWVLMDDSTILAEVKDSSIIIRGTLKYGTDLISPSASEIAAINGMTVGATELNLLVQGVAGGYKIARGQATTGSASDTVVTGLATVVIAIANLESAPVLTCAFASAHIGNQAGVPAAGSILVKTWMPTLAIDATPIAATIFSKVVNWFAIGV